MSGLSFSLFAEAFFSGQWLAIPDSLQLERWSWAFIIMMIFFFFFFGYAHGMQKFPGQGSNSSYSIDNARSLTCWAIRELLFYFNFFVSESFFFFFNGHTHSIWKFLGQGLNLLLNLYLASLASVGIWSIMASAGLLTPVSAGRAHMPSWLHLFYINSYKVVLGSSPCGASETNITSTHEDVGLITSLT